MFDPCQYAKLHKKPGVAQDLYTVAALLLLKKHSHVERTRGPALMASLASLEPFTPKVAMAAMPPEGAGKMMKQ